MRQITSHTIPNGFPIKEALLHWSKGYDEVVWLDSNKHTDRYSSFEALLAVDGLTALVTDAENAFEDLISYRSATNDWIFGYLSYDLKNDTEKLSSGNPDHLQFPELYFFQPKKIIRIIGNTIEFEYLNMVTNEQVADHKAILSFKSVRKEPTANNLSVKLRIFKEEYLDKVNQILTKIHKGDIYEVNFCQEFYALEQNLDAYWVFEKLNAISRPPFSCFLRLYEHYLLCGSPERFLKKQGSTVISQPIKGTAKRSKNRKQDAILKQDLQQNSKEVSENIMIVDLVRNDLSKWADKGSVSVDELCKVYTFDQVHQMISTVTAKVSSAIDPVDIVKAAFPMGSMTGAPKIAAMQVIERLESFKRGLYSGAVGYFSPNGDFDFNVVIRSILYNRANSYISFPVGSAITARSVPIKEYEECLLKAKAMRQVLES